MKGASVIFFIHKHQHIKADIPVIYTHESYTCVKVRMILHAKKYNLSLAFLIALQYFVTSRLSNSYTTLFFHIFPRNFPSLRFHVILIQVIASELR